MKMNRRELLKLSGASLLMLMLNPFVSAQNNGAPAGLKRVSDTPAIDGNISYNAGWVVPLEDKVPLLELEAKKTKEREDTVKQKSGAAVSSPSPKEKSKSISDKFQELLGKVKSFF